MIPAVETAVAGLVGGAAMSATMASIHLAGWANADMTRALGALVTRTYENALLPGVVIHALASILFAVPYCAVLGALAAGGALLTVGLGALMGFVHGLLMSLVLLAVVSERHPVPRFREAGFEVGVAHIAGHVAYGIAVALVVVALHIRWGLEF